jgi:hypothetical protein
MIRDSITLQDGPAGAPHDEAPQWQAAPSLHRQTRRPGVGELLLLAALTCGAVVLHGYHGGVEDAEIYLPGVLKLLNPALYPRNAEFFGSHAGMTFYPNLIAQSIRLSHIPSGTAMLLWHLATIYGFLFACFRIARLCFRR